MSLKTKKDLAREAVQGSWNYEENEAAERGQTLVYASQRELAAHIVAAFHDGKLLVTAIAPPQWGKTGTIHQVIHSMTTHIDEDAMILPQNVFVVTGMSDTDWCKQTKQRLLPMFRDQVYHRNEMRGLQDALRGRRDCLIVIDECHFACESDQTVHRCFSEAGLLDVNVLKSNNVRILSVSATPAAMLLDAQTWGSLHAHVCANVANAPAYTSFKDMLAEKRVRSKQLKSVEDVTRLMDDIEARWQTPRWHILRVSDKELKRCNFHYTATQRGFLVIQHNSTRRVANMETLLKRAPDRHHFLLIKGFWRAATTLDDTHIGVCYDNTKDYLAAAQGLAGRLCGYNRQRGETAPLLYTNVCAIEQYVVWMNHQCDYFQCAKHLSSALKIKMGVVLFKKNTTMEPSGVANLTPVVVQRASATELEKTVKPKRVYAAKPLKKIGVVVGTTNPDGAKLASTFETLPIKAFLQRFGLTSMPASAQGLSKALKAANVKANVSFTANSANSVSNLMNYFKHPEWALADFQIYWKPDEGMTHVSLVSRKHDVLQSLQKGDRCVFHTFDGVKILYEYRKEE